MLPLVVLLLCLLCSARGCTSILRVFLLHFVFMHLQWQFLFFLCLLFFLLLFLLRCCTLAGAWKANSDDNARQRAARGRQSRFYATFYDCQQWAETERHPCRIVCPIDISFMWSLWACHLHYFHYILLDNFAVFVCVCVVISCCTLMIVSLSPLSVPLCLLPSVRGIKNSKS